jgi:hypothetical protein
MNPEQNKIVRQNENGSWTVDYRLDAPITFPNKEDAFLLDRVSKQIHRDNSKPSPEMLQSALAALSRIGLNECNNPLCRSILGRLEEARTNDPYRFLR